MYWVSPSVRRPVTGRRVAWARGLTMARCWPMSALSKEDLPTFGAPASAIWPVRGMREGSVEGRWDEYHTHMFGSTEKRSPGIRDPRASQKRLATAYSPTISRWQYHRRC